MGGVIVDESKDQEIIERMKTDDYKIFRLPKAVQSVYTTFPFNSVFSLPIAMMRVPSRLGNFLQVRCNHSHRVERNSFALLDKQIDCLSDG